MQKRDLTQFSFQGAILSNFNRKLNKLKKDPKLFFMDMKKNYVKKKNNNLPVSGSFYYTVISAVYNVDKYLDDYFNSLIKQSISFEKHIQLILVDDGSTDNSAKTIKKWQSKYPKNITYLYKENGGLSSARNLGLKYVTTPWVTFVDPDDFLDKNYFCEVDEFIGKNIDKNLKLVACQFVYYIESLKTFRDNHPLKYRFNKGNQIFPYYDLGRNIHISASTAFFSTRELSKNSITFDNKVQSIYEDGHFTATYFANLKSGSVGFVEGAKYFYRKREDGSSILDNAWSKKEKYSDVIKHGHIFSLQIYKEKYGFVPVHAQRTILYDIVWYCKHLVNRDERIAFLSDNEKSKFIEYVRKAFELIDESVVMDFELAGCWFYFKVGILNCFKDKSPGFQTAYIQGYDSVKKQILISYYTGIIESESFQFDGKDCIPTYSKTVKNEFFGEIFALERRFWLTIPNDAENGVLKFTINGLNVKIAIKGKYHNKGVLVSEIETCFPEKHNIIDCDKFDKCWILLDRDIQADDNAEHLYRYIKSNHPYKKSYFALRKESHDWKRLKDEGFQLLEFGSYEYEDALRRCDKIISSHTDLYVMDYFRDGSLLEKDFIFLQHGVTKDDMSSWFNSKKMSKLIVAGNREYSAISGDNTRYKFSEKEVALTGFPRHDSLLRNNNTKAKNILVMPTWRESIVGKVVGNGNFRELNKCFMETKYAKMWSSFLANRMLFELSEKYGYNILFFPHANIQPYIKGFRLPEYVKVISHVEGSIQKLFQESALMITDYSSVAFEMAYLNKPIIYYQFDRAEVYSGGHIYSKGYFEYERDGFGPVVEQQNDLLKELEAILHNGGCPHSKYQDRMDIFFPFKDGKCCERTYNAILEIDQPESPDYSYDQLLQYAESASRSGDWDVAVSRWQKVIEKSPDDISSKLQISEALIHTGQVLKAKSILESCEEGITPELETNFLTHLASIYLLQDRWDKCEQVSGKLLKKGKPSIQQMLGYLQILAEQGKVNQLNECISKCCSQQVYDIEGAMIKAIVSWGENDTCQAIEVLTAAVTEITDHITLKKYKPQLLLAKLLRLSGVYDAAHGYLADYEKHTSNDPYCRLEIARLSAARNIFDKVVNQLIQAFPEGITAMSSSHALMYLSSLRKIGNVQKALSEIESFEAAGNSTHYEIAVEKAILLMELKDWAAAGEVLTSIEGVDSRYHYLLAKCYRMMGLLDQALKLVLCRNSVNPSNSEEWLLRAELAQLKQRWDIASESWSEHLRLYPDQSPGWVWERYQSTQLLNNIVSSSTKAS